MFVNSYLPLGDWLFHTNSQCVGKRFLFDLILDQYQC